MFYYDILIYKCNIFDHIYPPITLPKKSFLHSDFYCFVTKWISLGLIMGTWV